MKNVLLIYSEKIAFVREDVATLKNISNLTERPFALVKNPVLLLREFLKQFVFLLFNGHKFNCYYIWFADYHAFLPVLFSRLFGKKSIIILGGYDTMALKSINYGVFANHNLRRRLVKYSVGHADFLLGVDESMFEGVNTYISEEPVLTGVRNFIPKISGECRVVPTGYDADRWKKNSEVRKRPMVVSIGMVRELKGIHRKGFDFLTEVARQLPEIDFVIIGPNEECKNLLLKDAPANLTVHSFMPQDEFKNVLDEAKVFCQFSLAEGLPNTLCEAMLCECIPVGSSVNGIPKAIGNPQLIINKPNVQEAALAIKYALSMPDSEGSVYRQRIIDMFPKSKREQSIQEVLSLC